MDSHVVKKREGLQNGQIKEKREGGGKGLQKQREDTTEF